MQQCLSVEGCGSQQAGGNGVYVCGFGPSRCCRSNHTGFRREVVCVVCTRTQSNKVIIKLMWLSYVPYIWHTCFCAVLGSRAVTNPGFFSEPRSLDLSRRCLAWHVGRFVATCTMTTLARRVVAMILIIGDDYRRRHVAAVQVQGCCWCARHCQRDQWGAGWPHLSHHHTARQGAVHQAGPRAAGTYPGGCVGM